MSQPRGERPSLVVAALGEPSTRQWHPCDDIDRWQIVTRRDRRGESPSHIAPSRELEAVHGASRRTVEEERRPSRRHRVRRAVTAGRHRHAGWAPASVAPGTHERHERHTARGTERPRPGPASGAPAWEDDIQRPREHVATVPATADIARAGRPRPVRFPGSRSSGDAAIGARGTPRGDPAPTPHRTRSRAPGGKRRPSGA